MDADWRSSWGNWIVANRTPANWKAYGEETGRELASNEWDDFLFWRDPQELSLTPKAVAEKAEAMAQNLVDDIQLYGIEMWRDYGGENRGTPQERRIWVQAFTQAYADAMDRLMGELIPRKLWKNLDLFCTLLSWLRLDMDHGSGRAEQYGLRLGAKKPAPEPPKPTYKPGRREMRAAAERAARQKLEFQWRKFMARKSSGSEFRTSMLRFGARDMGEGWALSDLDRDYMSEIVQETFQEELGKKALTLAPASAWENAYLICVLYHHLEDQRGAKKKGDEQPQGFKRLEYRRDWEEERERAAWREAERAKIRKELEREAARAQKPKMSGPAREEADGSIVLYHGTLLEFLPEIKAHGIERGEGWGGAGTSGAFLSGTPEGALYWAKMAYQRTHEGDLEIWRFDRAHGHEVDDLLAIVAVRIPAGETGKLMADVEQFEDVGARFDPSDWRRSLEVIGDVRFEGEIPPGWIEGEVQPSRVRVK